MLIKSYKKLFADRNIDDDKKDLTLEKGDFSAIVIAAFTTLLPVLLIIFAIFAIAIAAMFGR